MPDAALPTGTVTFVFTDIEGSTQLLTSLGADYAAALSQHNVLVRQQIGATGGVEVRTEGDAFFIVFTDAPAATTFAALAQRALAAASWPGGSALRVRMGIHTGRGALSEGDYVGLDVHLAARIGAAAHGGQVVLSESARALTARSLPAQTSLRELGEHRLKDFPAAMPLFQLVIEGLAQDFPPLRAGTAGNLPDPLTSFVGRDAELAEISDLVEHSRLVTLTGPGGTGKTRLSIEVARLVGERYSGGAWFVPLDTISQPELVLPAIGHSLAVREQSGRPIIDSLAEALGKRQLLVVLDNFEQVIAAAPEVATLLAAAPGPHFLCSSREALHISGEQEYPVPPLAVDPAVRLFVERARLVKPGFAPSGDELEVIGQICHAVDGLPLAIELAAARTRLFALGVLLSRLSDRLDTLASGARDLPERQRTLRGAIDWSYELLDEPQRQLFARLSVFAGGADLTAIEAIIDPERELGSDVIDGLSSLADKSLLSVEDGPAGEPRFVMLETIREYATERLAVAGTGYEFRDRHLDWFLRFAEAHEAELSGGQAAHALALLDADQANLRAALEWSVASGQPGKGLRIGGSIWRFWQLRGHLAEGRQLLERLLDAPGARDDPWARARGLTGYGGIGYWLGDRAAAVPAYREALELYRVAGDEPRTAAALIDLAFPVAQAGGIDEARRLVEESEAIYRRRRDERGETMAMEGRGAVAVMTRDFAAVRDIVQRLVAYYRRLGMPFRLAETLTMLALMDVQLGEAARGRRWLAESLPLFAELGDSSSYAAVLQIGAMVALGEGRLQDGARLAGTLGALRERGDRVLVPTETIGVADPEPALREALGDADFAVAYDEGRRMAMETALETIAHPPGTNDARVTQKRASDA